MTWLDFLRGHGPLKYVRRLTGTGSPAGSPVGKSLRGQAVVHDIHGAGGLTPSASSSRTGPSSNADVEKGLLVFHNTAEVIRAERILRQAGFAIEVKGPPPDLRTGCDMVVLFPLMLELSIKSILDRERLEPLHIVPLRDLLLEPVNLFHVRLYGTFLMVRAANMKITVDGRSGRIVNISGGGCPDVPYLASLLVGKKLDEAEEPKVHGKTLCSYSLQKAFEEIRRVMSMPGVNFGTESFAPPSCVRDTVGEEPSLAMEMRPYKAPRPSCLSQTIPKPWLICGTAPVPEFPLTLGEWALQGDSLVAVTDPHAVLPVQRGTPALLAAAIATCQTLGVPPPHALLVGDDGTGLGSRQLYRHLAEQVLPQTIWQGLTFHYLFPDLDGHNKVLMALQALPPGRCPLLVADAGYMYVAKMSGYASEYDLFTPDLGELAFLADEKAPHPFYTRGFLLAADHDVPDLVERAYAHGNSARYLLIKGEIDRIVEEGRVLATVDQPLVPAMEPIGGTGDLVTGMATGLLAAGFSVPDACVIAARANRLIGQAARPDPATQVADLLRYLPEVIRSLVW